MSQEEERCSKGGDRDLKSSIRQRIPYRLFGKKLFKTKGRLVASSQVLKNTIPTSDCDVLVTFPVNTETSTLMWLLDRLRSRTPELIVHVRHHSNTKGSVFHITATHQSLLKGAEELAIRKHLKEEYGGGMKEFTYEDHDCFDGVMDEVNFFASQERQSIVSHMLNNLRAIKGEQLGNVKFLEGQAIVPMLESNQIISQVFPLHNPDSLVDLRLHWVQAFFSKQPLNKVCDYFGVKIAMYFAYLGHYTMALCVPAFMGILIWFFQGLDEVNDDVWFVIFALFNAFWATLYLEHWKRRSSELAYDWGTMDKKDELLEDPRPLFSGDLVQSPITGKMDFYYPAWKRHLFRYFVSWPVIFLCLCVVFAVMLLIFELQEWVNILVLSESIPSFCSFLPKILLAVSIGILDEIYKKVAYWLNEKENYRMEEQYENHLIIKLVLFVNSFLSLFYIAFYLQDMDRLCEQLAAILITRQVIGNIKEALLPYLLWKARLYKVGYEMITDHSPLTPEQRRKSINVEAWIKEKKEKKEEKKEEVIESSSDSETEKKKIMTRELSLTQAEVESAMKKYEGTFEDYLEMFIQFGYVTLFSSAFPLAALCALLNNIIEIRSDAFKLCVNHQRPFGQRVENIGTWQDALELMGFIAVMVNCGLIFVSGQIQRMFTHSTTISALVIIVILEHVILALKFLIAYAIPDIPDTIAAKKAKLEYLRREALKKLESQIGQPNSPDIKDRITFRHKSRMDACCQVGTASDSVSMTTISSSSSSIISSSSSSSSSKKSYQQNFQNPGNQSPSQDKLSYNVTLVTPTSYSVQNPISKTSQRNLLQQSGKLSPRNPDNSILQNTSKYISDFSSVKQRDMNSVSNDSDLTKIDNESISKTERWRPHFITSDPIESDIVKKDHKILSSELVQRISRKKEKKDGSSDNTASSASFYRVSSI